MSNFKIYIIPCASIMYVYHSTIVNLKVKVQLFLFIFYIAGSPILVQQMGMKCFNTCTCHFFFLNLVLKRTTASSNCLLHGLMLHSFSKRKSYAAIVVNHFMRLSTQYCRKHEPFFDLYNLLYRGGTFNYLSDKMFLWYNCYFIVGK